jgi:acetyl-CoA carboxylase biotin carboxylase subunit
VPSHYDSLIGKLIAHGDDRPAALARMRQALREIVIGGINSNAELHRRILDDAGFAAGGVNIHYLQEHLAG